MTSRRDLLAATLALALARCSRCSDSAAPASSAPASSAPSASARPRVARRVVSIAPATTEALFALGAGAQVVGRSRFCDFPPEAARLPIVGGFVDADLEAILQLEPDLVVGGSGPDSPRLGDKLGARGIASWFPSIESIASIEDMLAGLGDRTGHAAEARGLTAAIDVRSLTVERAVATESAPSVLMVLGVDPVVAAGPKSFLDELLRRARANNVVTSGAAWQTVELERVVELDPDVVLDASGSGGGASRINAEAPGFSQLRAVRAGRVIPVTDARVMRPGPRVAEGLAVLARALHPRVASALL